MVWLLFVLSLHAEQVRGIVVDQHGQPVAFAGTTPDPRLSCCLTDSSGRYSFTTGAPFYLFRKAGYQSAVVRTRDQVEERVVMRQLVGSEAVLPSCGKKAGKAIGLDGSLFRFRDVSRLETSGRGRDVDFTVRAYSLDSYSIRHGLGPMWSLGLPSLNLLNKNYEEKVWDVQGRQIIDARGDNYEGKLWRFLGILGETVEYRDVDPATARIFDKFLDSVCITVAQ